MLTAKSERMHCKGNVEARKLVFDAITALPQQMSFCRWESHCLLHEYVNYKSWICKTKYCY
jgi:hypothetical protein